MDNVEKTALAESEVEEKTQWHNAFFVAIQAQLIDYKDDLTYESEHPLTTEPLRIDVLVIKKRPETVVKKQIAEIFRRDNIMEYKSPTDNLSINEFYKSFARAFLYKALDDIDIAELTLSFVVTSQPRELFRHLHEQFGYTVEERYPGVFVVTGAMIPIQVINSTKLSEEENLWLRNLNRNLTEENLRWIHGKKREYGERIDLSAYLYAVFAANHKAIEEIISKEGNRMLTAEFCETIEKIGLGAKWELKGKIEVARNLLKVGDPIDKVITVTGLTREEVENLRGTLLIQ